jgi:hypothetical protein
MVTALQVSGGIQGNGVGGSTGCLGVAKIIFVVDFAVCSDRHMTVGCVVCSSSRKNGLGLMVGEMLSL